MGSQESRFESFSELLLKVREATTKCEEKAQLQTGRRFSQSEKDILNMQCKDEAMNPLLNSNWQTNEMAYLFLAYFIIDRGYEAFNSETIIAPLQDPQFKQAAEENVRKTCVAVKKMNFHPDLFLLKQKAEEYCRTFNF